MPGKGDWILSWMSGTLERFQSEEDNTTQGLRAYECGDGCQLDWRQENTAGETRGSHAGEFTPSYCPQGWDSQSPGDQEVAGPTLCESSPQASGDWGLNCRLTLCFFSGSECATSCLDHNSESIILPANVTVRDIPHWLNPTRVEVSDRGPPPEAQGREMTLSRTGYALVLH